MRSDAAPRDESFCLDPMTPTRIEILGPVAPGLRALAALLRIEGHEILEASAEGASSRWVRRERSGRSVDIRIDQPSGSASGLFHRPGLLVHPTETPVTHPARLRATRKGVRQCTTADLIGSLLANYPDRVVTLSSGATPHGLPSQIAHLLITTGLDPRVILSSANCPALGGWCRPGKPPLAIVDAQPGFPESAIDGARTVIFHRGAQRFSPITLRHLLERRATESRVLATSRQKEKMTPWTGGTRLETYGTRRGVDWRIRDIQPRGDRLRVRVFHRGHFVVELLPMDQGPGQFGELACTVALACQRGIPVSDLSEAVETFPGVPRRWERLGSYRGVQVIDQQVESVRSGVRSLTHLRQSNPGRRLVVLTDLSSGNLGRTWHDDTAGRDSAILKTNRPVYLLVEPGRVPTELSKSIPLGTDPAIAVSILEQQLEPGDLLLSLGSRFVRCLADAFLRRNPRPRPAV